MNNKFKTSSLVKCIDTGYNKNLTLNKVYIRLEVDANYINIIDDSGHRGVIW